MAGVKGKSGRKPNELVLRQNLLNILDTVDPSTDRKRMLNVLHTLVDEAENGEAWAIKEVMDRVDGKPQQVQTNKVEGAGENGEIVFRIVTGVPREDD